MKTLYDGEWMERMKRSIKRYDIISFDIFDTLLLRPFLQPVDLFYYLEEKYKADGFAACRIHTEQALRANLKGTEEITLSEIYELMPSFQQMQQRELDTEAELLYCNHEMKELYDFADEQGKTVIIVSDIYLEESFIQELLRKNGYDRHQRLFVSSAWGKEKWTGNLFRIVLGEMQADPAGILHIGDNPVSDIKGAQTAGIDGLLYTKVMDQNRNRHDQGYFFRKTADTEYSSMAMQFADRCRSPFQDYWDRFGYELAGPFVYAYICWIMNYVSKNQEISDLVFVARDGYLLHQAYRMLAPDSRVRCHYVYAPRAVNLKYLLDYRPGFKGDGERARYIVSEYGHLFPKIDMEHLTDADALALLSGNHEKLQEAARLEFEKYKKYISGLGIGSGKVAVVDSITDKFSSQNVIEHALANEVVGLYWMVLRDGLKNAGTKKFACFQKEHYFRLCNWDIAEFILSSPEPAVSGVDNGVPVYGSANAFESRRREIFEKIELSVMEFISDRKKLKVQNLNPKADTVIDWVNDALCNPLQEDLDNFEEVYFSINADHMDMIPLQPFTGNTVAGRSMKKVRMAAYKIPFVYHVLNGIRKIMKLIFIRVPGKLERILLRPLLNEIRTEIREEMSWSEQRLGEILKNEMEMEFEGFREETGKYMKECGKDE